jgi:hypothetical protein
MGKVIEKVKITNLLEPTKSVEVEAVIDTGATMVVLPQNVVNELVLKKIREVKVRYANNSLEILDLVVDPRTRTLIPNPMSPEMPMAAQSLHLYGGSIAGLYFLPASSSSVSLILSISSRNLRNIIQVSIGRRSRSPFNPLSLRISSACS